MRVVLTSAHAWPQVRRGAERYVHELGRGLQRAGHDVTIVTTGRPPRREQVLDVDVVRVPSRPRVQRLLERRYGALGEEQLFGLQSLAQLLPRLLGHRLDVWHATTTADAAAAAVAMRRLSRPGRSVFTDHGFPARASRSARADRRAYQRIVDDIDVYVCGSRVAAGYLARDYGRPAAVVPPGVAFADHHIAPRNLRPTVLFAGAVDEPRKGVGLLLDAAELLLGDHPDLELWLLGPGDVSSHLAHRPSALRRAVSRCGPVGDEALRAAYATAWVTALPSVAEAFGMTIVESWASGTPAVVRADSGGPAELGVDGDLGRTCAGTAPDLAAALGECLELARRPATSERCRERAAGYDWDRVVVPMLVDLYAGAAA